MKFMTGLKTFSVLSLGLMISACGNNKENLNLSGLDIRTSSLNQVTYLNMEAFVKVGKMKFPNVEIPIINPQSMKSFGQLSLFRTADEQNKIAISVDLSSSTKLDPTLGFSLPNFREIPLALGATDVALIGIPILQHSRIYVGGDMKKDLYLGAAIVIPALDPVLNQVQIPLNVFTSFPLTSKIMGVGGLFTSPMPDQNGLAVFVKRSANGAVQGSAVQKQLAYSRVADGTLMNEEPVSEIQQMDERTLKRLNRHLNRSTTIRIR
jgi:hypothetical protein